MHAKRFDDIRQINFKKVTGDIVVSKALGCFSFIDDILIRGVSVCICLLLPMLHDYPLFANRLRRCEPGSPKFEFKMKDS